MNWKLLESFDDLTKIIEDSNSDNKLGTVIFKHSTRCLISKMAKSRLEDKWQFGDELPIFYLDILNFRSISNEIADRFMVRHESPQLLFFKNGECVYHASHGDIDVQSLVDFLEVKS